MPIYERWLLSRLGEWCPTRPSQLATGAHLAGAEAREGAHAPAASSFCRRQPRPRSLPPHAVSVPLRLLAGHPSCRCPCRFLAQLSPLDTPCCRQAGGSASASCRRPYSLHEPHTLPPAAPWCGLHRWACTRGRPLAARHGSSARPPPLAGSPPRFTWDVSPGVS